MSERNVAVAFSIKVLCCYTFLGKDYGMVKKLNCLLDRLFQQKCKEGKKLLIISVMRSRGKRNFNPFCFDRLQTGHQMGYI